MPSFQALTKRTEITTAQQALEQLLAAGMRVRPGKYTVGYQGNSFQLSSLKTNGQIWHYHHADSSSKVPRHWNAFGLTPSLRLDQSNDITVEINIPLAGASRLVSGLFARTKAGRLALLHSGKIGGGRKGIGKDGFLASYGQPLVTVDDSAGTRSEREALLITEFDDPLALRKISAFVLAVALFKSSDGSGDAATMPMSRLRQLAMAAPAKPGIVLRTVSVFNRNVNVDKYTKRRANGICDLCRKLGPFVVKGKPFLECHHIQQLSDNGDDKLHNTVALCPNCHRYMHMAATDADRDVLRKRARQ